MSDEIRRFLGQYSDHPESLVFARLADAYRKAEELERGLEVVEEGLQRHPDYLSAHIVRARILRQLERPAAAAAAFHRVLTLDPQNQVALRSLGELARERGDGGAARRWYARLAELEPMDEEVRAILESLEGAVPEAGETASEEGIPEGPGGERPDDERLLTATMAELYMRQGLYEDAERIYRRLVRRRPDDETLRDKLESVRVRIGGTVARGAGQSGDAPAGQDVDRREADRHEADRQETGRREREVPGAETAPAAELTIRRYLQELLEGRAPVPEASDRPRPSAFDAWLERHRDG